MRHYAGWSPTHSFEFLAANHRLEQEADYSDIIADNIEKYGFSTECHSEWAGVHYPSCFIGHHPNVRGTDCTEVISDVLFAACEGDCSEEELAKIGFNNRRAAALARYVGNLLRGMEPEAAALNVL